MAVYERTYRPYQGTLTPERTRFLVLPRYAYREIFRTKLFASFDPTGMGGAPVFGYPITDLFLLPDSAVQTQYFQMLRLDYDPALPAERREAGPRPVGQLGVAVLDATFDRG